MFALLLQSVWDWLLTHDALLSSPFFPVLFSLGTYLLFCLPYVALDLLSPHVELIRRYKIQQRSHVPWEVMWSCLVHSLYNHVMFIFPLTVLNWYWRKVSLPAEAPHPLKVAHDLLACLLLFDFQYFVWHTLHHKPWLYIQQGASQVHVDSNFYSIY